MKTKISKLIDLGIVLVGIGLLRFLFVENFAGKQDLALNASLQSDLEYLSASLRNYQHERNTLPEPRGNTQVFTKAGKYLHSQRDENTYGVSGFVQDGFLPLSGLSLTDPRTNHHYGYSKTKSNTAFEVAGVWKEGTLYKSYALSEGLEHGSVGLIKEFAGPHFVDEDPNNYLPYPIQTDFIAKIESFSGDVKIDGYSYFAHQLKDFSLKKSNSIEVGSGSWVVVYYGNGGMSRIGSPTHRTKVTMQHVQYDMFGAPSLQLFLDSGEIWSRITHSSVDTPFIIITEQTISRVVGTEFGMSIDGENNTNLTVKSGKVIVQKVLPNSKNKNILSTLNNKMKGDILEVKKKKEHTIDAVDYTSFEDIIMTSQDQSYIEVVDGENPKGFWSMTDGSIKAGTITQNES